MIATEIKTEFAPAYKGYAIAADAMLQLADLTDIEAIADRCHLALMEATASPHSLKALAELTGYVKLLGEALNREAGHQ